jgi:cytochrome c-type biogenesis protein CcmH/NrfF
VTQSAALPTARSGQAAFRRFFVGRYGYLALAGLLVVFLLIGDGTKATTPDAARIAYLESIIRCPSCADLSIADSEAPSASGVRIEVVNYVHEGLSDQAIESRIEAVYPDTLLVPTGGVGIAVFLIPALVIVVGAITFGVLFSRRTKRLSVGDGNADAALVAEAQRRRQEGQ